MPSSQTSPSPRSTEASSGHCPSGIRKFFACRAESQLINSVARKGPVNSMDSHVPKASSRVDLGEPDGVALGSVHGQAGRLVLDPVVVGKDIEAPDRRFRLWIWHDFLLAYNLDPLGGRGVSRWQAGVCARSKRERGGEDETDEREA